MRSASVGPQTLAEVRVHRAGIVERRLHDAPRPLDDVLAGEAARRAVEGVVEQPLVRLVALAEGGGEVDADVDLLAVEVRTGRLRLQART